MLFLFERILKTKSIQLCTPYIFYIITDHIHILYINYVTCALQWKSFLGTMHHMCPSLIATFNHLSSLVMQSNRPNVTLMDRSFHI